jgi:hypothetical protein
MAKMEEQIEVKTDRGKGFSLLKYNEINNLTKENIIMKQKYLIIFILAGVALTTMGTQCDKEFPPPIIHVFKYAEKVTLTPFKKVYAVNDTIWLQFQTMDKTLFDKVSGKRISTDTTFLKVSIDLVRQFPVEFIIENYAEVTVINGINVNFAPVFAPRDNLFFNTECNNGPYFFKVSIVLKKTGVFTLEPFIGVSPCPDKKTVLPSSFSLTFDLDDCNYDIYKSLGRTSYSGLDGYADVGIQRKEIFAFKVE